MHASVFHDGFSSERAPHRSYFGPIHSLLQLGCSDWLGRQECLRVVLREIELEESGEVGI